MAWTDEKRAKAVELYTEGNPTPQNTMELLEKVAEELEESKNGVRLILSKAGVYVKKEESTTSTKTTTAKTTTIKISKADSIGALKTSIESIGCTVDEEIVSKLTGKQAVYFTSVIEAAKQPTED